MVKQPTLSYPDREFSGQVRNVLSRELPRVDSEVETHYGKPEIFSLEKMLEVQKIIVYSEDIVQTFPDPSYGIGSQITIYRANPIILIDGNNKNIYRTWEKTVRDFLTEKKLELGEKDIIQPGGETSLKKNLEIKITRVSETNFIEKISLDFKTIKKEDSNLEKGISRTEKVGKKGVKEKIYKIRRENGREVSRVLIEEKIVNLPQDEIVVYGTRTTIYGEGKATWYSWVSGMTAAHRTLPMGTKVRVINKQNGKSVVVTIVDRGPFGEAIIDLSKDAFASIGNLNSGKIPVRLEKNY